MQHKNNIQVNTPRVMFAATRSGSGKTTVTCGVLAALKKQNIKVQAYKCGPDYIDPMFHRTVLGIDTGNLDTFFDAIGRILARDTKDAELIVMEGVMGYYDGVGGTTTMASSYELSKVTKTPVVLIVDAKGASVTLAAIIRGIMEYKKDSHIKGQKRYVSHKRLNSAFMMHASTSPFYPLFSALDVNAQMHAGASGRLLWDDCVKVGIEARKYLLKTCRYIRPFIPPEVDGKPWDSYPTEQGFVPEEVFLERLPEIAKNAIADACTGSNPRQPSQEEMEKLLKCCYYDTEVDF